MGVVEVVVVDDDDVIGDSSVNASSLSLNEMEEVKEQDLEQELILLIHHKGVDQVHLILIPIIIIII